MSKVFGLILFALWFVVKIEHEFPRLLCWLHALSCAGSHRSETRGRQSLILFSRLPKNALAHSTSPGDSKLELVRKLWQIPHVALGISTPAEKKNVWWRTNYVFFFFCRLIFDRLNLNISLPICSSHSRELWACNHAIIIFFLLVFQILMAPIMSLS